MICPVQIITSPFLMAQRFVGLKEVPGSADNAQIMAMLKLDGDWPDDDEVPWCSAFVNYVMWLLRQPRSKSLRARSWLEVGYAIKPEDAEPGFDVAIFKRGNSDAGPDVIKAPGHVGFVAGPIEDDHLPLLGGNQSNQVSVKPYNLSRLLGIRRVCA